ncbi:MAG: ferrous iron transport protein A [Chthoniobacterales bacterium]
MIIPLSKLQIGETASIYRLPQAQVLANRLREMGLLRGTEITFVRKAPMGDPLEFRLRGYSLSLRGNDAEQVLVEKV